MAHTNVSADGRRNAPGETGNAVLQTIQSSEDNRVLGLLKARQKRQTEFEQAKTAIDKKHRRVGKIGDNYTKGTTTAIEEEFTQETVGLVRAEEYKEKRRELESRLDGDPARRDAEEKLQHTKEAKIKQQKKKVAKLSFLEDDEADDLKGSTSSKSSSHNLGKDPTAETDFLWDANRDKMLAAERQRLIVEYREEQERIKKEEFDITFSYWDGSGHQRTTTVEKGKSIGQFLQKCRSELISEFPELRQTPEENLIFVKEDVILPHTVTFHELIRDKARGKTGPLFKLSGTNGKYKDESHAGKIVNKMWYDHNKHIFPASRWEVYDPQKVYGKYTIDKDGKLTQEVQF